MKSNNLNETLRNFQLDNELYYDLEYIAECNKRNTKDQLTHLIEVCRNEYAAENGIKKVPRTKKRQAKLKAGKV